MITFGVCWYALNAIGNSQLNNMPPNHLPEFIRRLAALEQKVEQHLVEGVSVHTSIATLREDMNGVKKALWTVAGAFLAGVASLIVALITHFLGK